MGSTPPPPILCPLCGSRHQVDQPIGEQNLMLSRSGDLERGYRCPTQGGYQGNQAFQGGGAGSVNNDYDAHPIHSPIQLKSSPAPSEASTVRLDEFVNFHSTRKYSPAPSEASTVRMDDFINLYSPHKDTPTLSEASMAPMDEFSTLPIPPENSPGLTEASMEHLNHFVTNPIPQEDPNQVQAVEQNAYPSDMRHTFNLSTNEAGLQLLAEFNILPRPNQGRSASMPAEGNIRHYQHLVHGTELPPMPHRPESLPGSRSDWNAHQLWEEFPPPPSGRRGNTVEDCTMINDDDDDDNYSRTITMSMITKPEDDASVMLSVQDTVLPSVEEDYVMPNVEDTMLPSIEDDYWMTVMEDDVPPGMEDNDVNNMGDVLLPSVEDDDATSGSDTWGQF
ncbi:hypothetical protein KVR01_007892 [Diaporthe batatas]|uniref:uncharacterized protein n=1 Tax=Diaporthe batatas TaxID=748121 RepID=UPI001D050958|nr:uncharacterized protein KVR01_007892 [Diaporthe batatas]KAG8162127.1 hypothetical protein KVR01_007892 [Diaporthe batatas]